jgi:hypothetical protein
MMKSEDIAKQLSQQEQKKAALVSQMDGLFLEIQGAMPGVSASWMRAEVESKIKDNPEVAQSLGIEKLRELKSKLNALIEKLPEMVAAEFQDRGKWPHRCEKEGQTYYSAMGRSHISGILLNVTGGLGALLNELGLLRDPNGHIASWQRKGKDQFRYAHAQDTNGVFEPKLSEYDRLLGEYSQLRHEIKASQKLLSEARAKELWETA